jgi:hypothetical protein
MEDKTRKLIMAIEILALLTAALLILVDYKLKQDLIKLFERIEATIAAGQRVYFPDAVFNSDTGSVPDSAVVGDNPTVEAPASDKPNHANSNGRKATVRGTAANGSRGNRNQAVPQPGKPMGS